MAAARMTIRDRILDHLRQHPEGATDAELTRELALRNFAESNSYCHQLLRDGRIERRRVDKRFRNYAVATTSVTSPPEPTPAPPSAAEPVPGLTGPGSDASRPWFWEGNVQATVMRHLQSRGYTIASFADTASHQHGKDIVAVGTEGPLWVTVKGYPKTTDRTQASVQAAIWFHGALFDLLDWRGSSAEVSLALALPDFQRYRSLAQRVRWLRPERHAGFSILWVHEDGTVEEEL